MYSADVKGVNSILTSSNKNSKEPIYSFRPSFNIALLAKVWANRTFHYVLKSVKLILYQTEQVHSWIERFILRQSCLWSNPVFFIYNICLLAPTALVIRPKSCTVPFLQGWFQLPIWNLISNLNSSCNLVIQFQLYVNTENKLVVGK